MPLSDYDTITVSQFFNKAEGFFRHLAQLEEMQWLRTNYLVYAMISQNPYIDKKDKPKSFEDFQTRQTKPAK